ncbi:MAG: hypothetical protein KC912_19360 [Proteobacteria bacterium]|nr:hypothetical protein [Pseudomonadota bacterium]
MSSPPVNPLTVLLAVVFGVSLIGFLRGTDTNDYDFETPLRDLAEGDHGVVRPAVPYWEMRNSPRGDGPVLAADLAALEGAVPSRTDAVDLTGTSKREALADRAEHRAYFGAPPVIPHPVRQQTEAECKACHENGVRISGHQAPPYPHEAYVSCTQCHAMAEPALPWEETTPADPRAVDNSFLGVASPTEGERWTGVAPPVIPHMTFMRERCVSCHGPNGRDAMKSTHPDRQSCEQCHAADASIEQRPGGR